MSESDSYQNSVLTANGKRSKSKNFSKAKPGSLPWEEESMTFSRDNGSVFIKLQRENLELRKKLKEFNTTLNNIIEKHSQKKPKKTPLEASPAETLETVRKKLKYYE